MLTDILDGRLRGKLDRDRDAIDGRILVQDGLGLHRLFDAGVAQKGTLGLMVHVAHLQNSKLGAHISHHATADLHMQNTYIIGM